MMRPANSKSQPSVASKPSTEGFSQHAINTAANAFSTSPTVPVPSGNPLPILQAHMKQNSLIWETESFDHLAFIMLALRYNISGDIWDACSHNSEVGLLILFYFLINLLNKAAADVDFPRASQTWKMLQLLFGRQVDENPRNLTKLFLPRESKYICIVSFYKSDLDCLNDTKDTVALISQNHEYSHYDKSSLPQQPPTPISPNPLPSNLAAVLAKAGVYKNTLSSLKVPSLSSEDEDEDDEDDNFRIHSDILRANYRPSSGDGLWMNPRSTFQSSDMSNFGTGSLLNPLVKSSNNPLSSEPASGNFLMDSLVSSRISPGLHMMNESDSDSSEEDESGIGRMGIYSGRRLREDLSRLTRGGGGGGGGGDRGGDNGLSTEDGDAIVMGSKSSAENLRYLSQQLGGPRSDLSTFAPVLMESSFSSLNQPKYITEHGKAKNSKSIPKSHSDYIERQIVDRNLIIRQVLEFYADQGNVQMCATIVLIFKNVVNIPIDLQELWISSYIGN
jgi:hypothetical protein